MFPQQFRSLLDSLNADCSRESPNPPAAAVELFNRGVVCLNEGKRGEARAILDPLVILLPGFGWPFLALGQMALDDGRSRAAAGYLAKALESGRPEAFVRLIDAATRLCQEGHAVEAERILALLIDRAVSAAELETLTVLLGNLSAFWHFQGHLHRASRWMRRTLALTPGDSRIWGNFAASLKVQGLLDDAERACRRSLAVDPLNDSTHVNLLQTLEHQPDLSEEALFEAHVAWGRLYQGQAAGHMSVLANSADPERRLRIGYVGLNFSGGPRRLFVTHLLDHRDRAAFETFCYSAAPGEADPPSPLRDAADRWRTTAGMSDEDLAALIRADGIDVLVDLDGHSNGNRLRVFARKPAPVQISWVGYFHTTGLPAMDAIFMDEVMVPVGEESRFIEAVVRLPHSRFCYKAPDCAGPVVPPPCLKGGGVTFGSFNLIAKLAPQVIRTWSRILMAVPGSRLLLKSLNLGDPELCRRLEMAFEAEGIDRSRLDLRGPSSHEAMFEEYGDMDIALDPFPFTGGITSCEALWMGVPIVTMPGARPVSRQTAGLLKVLGLPELIVRDEDEYVRVAKTLAADPGRLKTLRNGLRGRMAASPLCDSAGMMRRVETAYRELWRGWCAGPMADGRGRSPAAPPTKASADTGDALLRRGIEFLREGRPQDAVPLFRHAAASQPGLAGAQGGLLRALAATGQHQALIEAALSAIRSCPHLLRQDRGALVVLFNAAVALYHQERATEALVGLEAVRQVDPDLPPLKKALRACHHVIGQQAAQNGDRLAARHHYEEALRFDPDAAELHAALGALVFKEHPRLSTHHTVRAWELDPGSAAHYSGAWQMLNKIGSDFSSLDELMSELAQGWTYAAQIGIGNALRQAGRAGDAEAAYRTAACRHPSYPFAYTRLGCLHAMTGRHEDADRCFARVGQGWGPTREEAIRLAPSFLALLPADGGALSGTVEFHERPAGPEDVDFVMFSSGDAAYIAKFAFSLVNSIDQNCRRPAFVHIHAINPDRKTEEEIERIKGKFPRISVAYSHERTEVEKFGDERKTYFACARFLLLPHLMKRYAKPILMLDMDLLLLRDPDPIQAMVGEADLGAVGGSMMEIWNEIWADVVYIRPTGRAIGFLDCAARYIRHFLDAGQARWFLDQIALFVAYHRRQPEETAAVVRFLPNTIHRMEMIVLQDGSITGSDDAFFWSVHASLPTSAQQITSPQFQAYCSAV